ncbi:MAG: hypothetical protein ABI016_04370 [Chthoniobacterales bacterium]
MNTKEIDQVLIDLDNVTLRFGEMEPVVIPRSAVRTRLRLLDLIYRLTGWPGMKVQYLRKFIAAIYRRHGWTLPLPEEDPLLKTAPPRGDEALVARRYESKQQFPLSYGN